MQGKKLLKVNKKVTQTHREEGHRTKPDTPTWAVDMLKGDVQNRKKIVKVLKLKC